ncbi:MAG TPA: Maf family nucleotide pyrophosphatase [Bacteroidales bacterium]|nr:Maf family nucleotide pyrophosphatase [Bacteroidales bacterium]
MLTGKESNFRIILASGSPRRQQLLEETGLQFETVIKEYDETFPDGLNGEETAMHVAHRKAMCFRDRISDGEIVITADTVVWCNGRILAKPVDRSDALAMLREISGNTHEVITGVSVLTSSGEITFSETTKVYFEEMSDMEISYYTDNYKPYDKAGAYGIQEWIGLIACSRIEGSYFNVVGLPVHRLYRELQAIMNKNDRLNPGNES